MEDLQARMKRLRGESTQTVTQNTNTAVVDNSLQAKMNALRGVTLQPVEQTQPQPSQPTYANHGALAQQGHSNTIAQKQNNITSIQNKTKVPTQLEYGTSREITPLDNITNPLKTIGNATVAGTAKLLDAGKMGWDYLTLNNTSLVEPEKLLNYSNGDRQPLDQRSYSILEHIAQNRPNDLDIQFLYNSVKDGNFAGTTDDIKRILDKSEEYYHNENYANIVQPSVDKLEQQLKESSTGHSEQYGNTLRGIANATEVIAPTVLSGGLGATAPISMGIGGAVQGENKMQQYLNNGIDYTEAAKNVPIETAKGLVFGTALKAFGPSMQVGITQNPANLGEAAKNILTAFRNGSIVGGTANLGTQALDLFKEDPNFDYVDWGKVEQGIKEGKYTDLDDYLNSRDYTNDWISSRTSQIFWAGMLTGGFNVASQIPSTMKAVKNALSNKFNAPKQLEADLKILGLEKDATPQEVRKAAHQLQKKYHSDITGTSANDAKLQEINEAYNRIQRIQSKTASSFITRLKNWASNLSKNTPATNTQPTQVNNAAVASDQALVPYANNAATNATNLGNIATQQATVAAQPAPQNIAEPTAQTNLPQQANNVGTLENSNQGSFSMPENNTMLPTNDELNNFAEQQRQAEIETVRDGAKALGLEKEKPSVNPPTEDVGSQPPEPPDDGPDEKVAELLKQRPERAKMTRTQKLEDAYRSLANKGYYVDKLADVSGNQQLKYKYDKMLSSANEGNYVVGEKQTDNSGNVIGKSVNEIWKPVEDAGKVEEFSDYLLHKLNIDRMSLENIEDLTKAETELSDFIRDNPELTKLSPRTIQRIADGKAVLENGKVVKVNPNLRDSITKDVKTTELQDLAKKYLELDKQVEILEGRKNKPVFGETVTADDSRAKVAEYEEKYPEFKEWDNDIKTFNKNQLQNMVDAGLTSEETQQLLNDMYDNYIRIQRQVGGDRPITNQRGRLKVNSPIKKAKGGNQDILPLKDSMAQQALEVKKAIARNQFGQELLNTLKNGEQIEDYGEVLQPSKNGQAPTFTVFVEGKPVTMKINEELYDAIKPSERASWEDSVIARGLQKGVVLQKTLLTSRNPIFAFTNFVRDLQTAIVNSKDTPKMLQNYAKLDQYKFAELYSKATGKELSDANKEIGRLWDLYKANGGEANTYFDFEKGTNLEEKNPVKRVINEGIDKVFALNEIIEQMPRVSEFITTLENGGTIDEAMYNAADITVNFKRGGDFAKTLDRNGASFLNASIQGLDKQIRNFTDAFKSGNKGKAFANLIIKAALIGIGPALVNHLLLSDDEDYQDLPDYIKDNYWLFKIGDDKFLRIPRGRDIPTFLGNITQRTTRAAQGDEHAFDGLVDTFSNTLAPNNPIESNVFAPLVAMGTNKSWNGSDIVSSTLQNKVPSQQYDAKDTEFAKWLGDKINVSPKKIDYLLDQYSGGIGDILIPMNTKYAEEGTALSAKFTTDSINSNKQLSRFYDYKTELTQKKNSNVATEQEQYQYKYFTDVGDEISDLNKKIKEIEMSDASDKEKIAKVTELRKQMNTLAKEANKNSKKYGEAANDYSDDIYEAIYNSNLYKDTYDKEKFKEKIRKKVAEDANTKAKEAIGNTDAAFKLNTIIEELDDANIPLADYYLAWYAKSNLSLGSTYASQQKAIRDNTDLTPEQEDVLFGIFNIEYKKGSK